MTCGCGCGLAIAPFDSRGRPRRFLRGHNLRGVDHWAHTEDPETWDKMSRRPPKQQAMPSGWLGRKHTPESRAKMSAAMRGKSRPNLRGERNGMYGRVGPLNPRYVDGSSPERQRLYASSEWRELMRQVKRRDGQQCTRCKRAGDLHVHHAKPWSTHPELRLELDNLVTLCRGCHHDAHRKGVVPSENGAVSV